MYVVHREIEELRYIKLIFSKMMLGEGVMWNLVRAEGNKIHGV
jgi:hypothetical protein